MMIRRYSSLEDLPTTLPVFPLTGAVLLPRGELPLNIFEARYLTMIDAALKGDRLIGMIQPKVAGEEEEVYNLGGDPAPCFFFSLRF